MVGSGPLILVNDLLRNAGLEAYNLFSVTPVGAILLLSGIAYFLVFGNKVMPAGESDKTGPTDQEILIEKLHLPNNIRLLSITGESSLAGKTTEQSGIWDSYNLHVLGIGKGEEVIYAPWRETKFEEGQTIAILGNADNIDRFSKDFDLDNYTAAKYFSDDFDAEKSGFAELIVPPGSELSGRNIRKYSLRKRFAVEPVLLFHKGEKVEGDFSDIIIAPGDTLVIYGKWEKITDMKASRDFIVISHFDAEKRDPSKSLLAAGCFLFALILAMLGFPISMAFLTGALCMILGRVLNIGEAYQAIEWKVVFLLAGLIPLGVAMEKTGTARFLAESIMTLVIDLHPFILILTIGLLSTLFSLFMSNVGAIVVLVPLVMGMATIAGIDPKPVALMAAVCAANSFILPTHQVNAFLMSSGAYRNIDYLRAGSGMTLVFLFVVVSLFYFIII
jgi:di/tricarboxylate transporter